MATTAGTPMLIAACALFASAALAAHSLSTGSSHLYAPQAVRTTQGITGVLRAHQPRIQSQMVEAHTGSASVDMVPERIQSASQPQTKLWSLGALALAAIAFAVSFLKKRAPRPATWAFVTTGGALVNEDGFEMQREGIKKAAKDSILTPRFYTTDFEECARILSTDINPGLNLRELEAMREEFAKDYNQNHFIRNDKFKPAAAAVQGESRKIFVEFLERSCTAEFSGFLLYKELGRRLKTVNPVIADIFTLMSRDEARHAGFLNKTMSDFNLALDLGFLTKHREYTFFQPKFILYATYLSEKIGYWRYISIYRHLQRNPDNQFSPLFQYFENWCQDENRHGDFLAAILKVQPDMLKGWDTKLWCRFFCHTVYITMYLNDHQRSKFYEQCGLNTTQFNQHVIRETNATTARIFPAVPNVLAPDYFPKMDKLVELNGKVIEIGQSDAPNLLKGLQRAPIVAQMAAIMLELFWEAPIEGGSIDIEPELAQFV
eukprot:TRINITY_DN22_c0_g1_i2.p1 TRINITY_DN22_c0_g1~~TRINITY_DN22_c0_g1_i2.p1  ORF type:complete len:497 (+),score=153.01 TRINITY_DN22_c0_g1_i2:22-1491(+)